MTALRRSICEIKFKHSNHDKQSLKYSIVLCRLFMDELKVVDLLRMLQWYFFKDAGDWAEHLTEAFCDATTQHDRLHEHSMQSMLDGSFKGGSVEQDQSSVNLRVSLQAPLDPALADRASHSQEAESSHSRSVMVVKSRLQALEAVQLSCEVQWPLSLVVTQV